MGRSSGGVRAVCRSPLDDTSKVTILGYQKEGGLSMIIFYDRNLEGFSTRNFKI